MSNGESIKASLVAEANSLLADASGRLARWWNFSASLSSFELLVGEASANNNLVLVLASCNFISGPVAWNTQRLVVRMDEGLATTPHSYVFELTDESVGFIARSNMFTFKQGWDLLELGSVMFPKGWQRPDA